MEIEPNAIFSAVSDDALALSDQRRESNKAVLGLLSRDLMTQGAQDLVPCNLKHDRTDQCSFRRRV